MDTIWKCAFGIDIDIQNNPDNEYFTKCERVFSDAENLQFSSYLGSKYFKNHHRIYNFIL